jgi:hypothetical protein
MLQRRKKGKAQNVTKLGGQSVEKIEEGSRGEQSGDRVWE